MKLFLDTSQATVILKLDQNSYEWQADKEMAHGLLKFIHDKLVENGSDWQDISELHFFSGPGSYTGLRIGATVINTLAHELDVPLYDQNGKQHQIIIPNYGHPAHTTPPKK